MGPDYYNFVIEGIIQTTNKELEFYKKYPFINLDHEINTYLTNQKNRIDSTEFYNKNNLVNMKDYENKLEEYVYKKEWKKLKVVHKKHKINQYIDTLKYDIKNKTKIKTNKKYLFDEIIKGMEDKKLKKNIVIDYDEKKMQIISISCIVFDEETGLYVVELE